MNRKCANYISYAKLPDYDSDIDLEDADDEYQCNYSFICIEQGSKKTFKKKANTAVLKPDEFIYEELNLVEA
jgi:hypothetical protein